MVYEVEEKDLKILDGYEKYYQRLEVKVMAAKEKNWMQWLISQKNLEERNLPPRSIWISFSMGKVS